MSATMKVDDRAILEAAKQAFWDLGYEWTGIDVLELRSGTDRATIQARFGSKRDLLDAALGSYVETFIGPRVAAMENPAAGVEDVVDFFGGLADYFEQDAEARRGCLMVNIVAELAHRDEIGDRWGSLFAARLGDAFRNALTRSDAAAEAEAGSPSPEVVLPGSPREARSRWLVTQTLGLWLMVRVDHAAAASAARGVAQEISRWSTGG